MAYPRHLKSSLFRQSHAQRRAVRIRLTAPAQLEDLLAQLFDAAEGCFAEGRQVHDDRDTQVEIFEQGAKLAKAYGQLLTVRNSHRKAQKEDR